ncbi:MAG: carbohydrate ABC transporter permease [Trueperaceae bacterium]|nr:carbohydrate ABC transporter permease [Trueperaceae bacterium]
MASSMQTPYRRANGREREHAEASMRKIIVRVLITSVTLVILFLYLMPLGYSILTSLKNKNQVSDVQAPLLPSARVTFEHGGTSYEVFKVPLEDGVRELAMTRRGRADSTFIDPKNPDAGEITWVGAWRTLEPVYRPDPQWNNYPTAFRFINFMQLLRNTLMYAIITTIAATSSAAIVAYGFARFRFPGKGLLFMVLISTIILPSQATMVPTYAFFFQLGWVGTWLPLIVPTFFSNAYNVFLLRQYFLTIPREIEDAARVDGAGPIATFLRVILPQALPALVAVSLFHFFFAWNDFFGPLIYLAGSQDLLPISVGLFRFNGLYSTEPQLIQAASIMTMVIPLLIFFFAQRFFIQGVVLTGVDK